MLILAAARAAAKDLVAVVDLKFLEETDQIARVMCFSDGDTDCVVWATHYLWKARVRKVISGTEPDKDFLVLFGVHALKKKDRRNVLAAMKKLEPGAYANARYEILDWGEERELMCFDGHAAPNAPLELSDERNTPERCFEIADDD